MNNAVWSQHRAILMQTDDWGMCAWAPTVAAYEAMHPFEFMRTPWSSGTLETPADMERMFSLLEQFEGGDGLPVVFEPIYMISSPDYDAIEANGFTEYVDIALDRGVSQGWARGDLTAKAREGLERMVWHPGYHGRAHHFSPRAWMGRLQRNEEMAHRAFKQRMYVCETVPERRPEYADMSDDALVAWTVEGLNRFERAFGYRARSARNNDFLPGQGQLALRTCAANGMRCVNTDGNFTMPDADLVFLPRAINFEPFMTGDHEDVVERTLADMARAWAKGEPVILSSHRRNYKAFDVANVERNFAALEVLLGAIARRYPDAVWVCGDEVAQLDRQGWSVVRRGARLVGRNYTNAPVDVAPDACGLAHGVTLPRGESVLRILEWAV